MMRKTMQGVVLRIIQFNDSSDIIHLFCRSEGRRAFISRKSSKTKSHKGSALFPLALVEFETSPSTSNAILSIYDPRSVKDSFPIESQLEKNAVAFYVSELLYRIIPEGFVQDDLFDFLSAAIVYFNRMPYAPNFHLWITASLIRELGIAPHGASGQQGFFDLKLADYCPNRPGHSFYLEQHDANLFCQLFALNMEELDHLKMNGKTRSNLLDALVKMISLHLVPNLQLKSLDVLKEVFL